MLRFLPLLVLGFLVARGPAFAQAPASGEVVVNEVMYDPPAPQASANEWVEVVNRSDRTVDVGGLIISDNAGASAPVDGSQLLAPGEFLVIVRNEAEFTTAYPGVPFVTVASFPSLNNGGDRVEIAVGGTVLDAIDYTPAWGGADASLERRDPDGPSTQPNFATSTAASGGTPGAENSAVETDTDAPELLSAVAESESIVIAQFSEPVDTSTAEAPANYTLSDGIGQPLTADVLDDEDARVRLTLGSPIPGLGTYTLTASGIEDRAGNALASGSVSFGFGSGDSPEARDLVINEFLYDEPTTANPGEFVELFNRTDKTFDLSDFTLNDNTGDDEPLASSTVILGPGEYAVIVEDGELFAAQFPGVAFVEQPVWSALNNTGDSIILKYQGSTIDALVYTSSWGGTDVSLERIDPRGPSSSASNWTETADPRGGTPGEQNSQFALDVTGPQPLAVTVGTAEDAITATFDEPLDPATVTAQAFQVTGGPAVASVTLEDGGETVTIQLVGRITGAGPFALVVQNLADLLGNQTPEATLPFSFTPDEAAPAILSVTAEDATTLALTFSEEVDPTTAAEISNYSISGGVGQPLSATVDGESVRLTLGTPLAGPAIYVLSVDGVEDIVGNALIGGEVTFGFGDGDAPEAGDLVLNEFLYDEPAADNPGEFVELFNRTDKIFDLADFTFNDASGEDVAITDTPTFVSPGGYAVLVEDPALFQAIFPGVAFVQQAPWNSLNNSGDALVLKYQGATVDSLFYSTSWGGEDASLERKDPRGPSSSASNWTTTLDVRGGTPGEQNSQFEPDVTGPQPTEVQVAASEIMLTVTFDEPLAPAAITAGAFNITGGPAVTTAELQPGDTSVMLTLASALPAGDYTLVATDLADPLGNRTDSGQLAFSFAADEIAPAISRAGAAGSLIVEVQFTEPVANADDPSLYSLDGGIGTPQAVEVLDGAVAARLTLPQPLQDRTLYTLTATGLRDAAGNVSGPSSASVFFGLADRPASGEIAITEIMFDPATGSEGEYVEVLNLTADRFFDLQTLILDDDPDGEARITRGTAILAPGEYLAIAADLATFRQTFPEAPALEATSFPNLGNSGDLVALLDASGMVIDSVRFDPDWHRVELDDATGVSLERRNPRTDANDSNNWSSSLSPLGGTPSATNSIGTETGPSPEATGLSFSESPFDAARGVTISYALEAEASLVRIRIYDGAGRLVRELEAARLSGRTGEKVWDGRDDRGEQIRIGPYIVLLEAVDTEGGTTEAYKGVVVLARQL